LVYSISKIIKNYGALRFFVAYDGEYLVQGVVRDFAEKTGETVPGRPEVQCVRFSCTLPASQGRGFIEVIVLFLVRVYEYLCMYPFMFSGLCLKYF
jgi:hypothetical protein